MNKDAEDKKKQQKNDEDDYEDEEEEEEEEEEEVVNNGEIVDLNFDGFLEEPIKEEATAVVSPKSLEKRTTLREGPILNLENEGGNEEENKEENQEENNEEPDYQENNFDHIKDPHVKMLMTMNVDEESKEDVLNILLNNKALDKKEKKPSTRGKKQFNVKSQYGVDKLRDDPNYKSANFLIHTENDNPEFTSDFGTARKKVLSKMTKEGDNPELLKLLASDKDKMITELESHDIVNRDYIDSKVKNYLSNKQKKVENIQGKINEEFMQKHTFNPELLSEPKGMTDRRNLEQFLMDQNNHNKKIQDKIKIAKEETKKKEDDQIKECHPKIDYNSAKIFDEKIKTDEPTHLRLYNKRYQNTKKDLLKTEPLIKSNKKKTNRIDDYLEKKKEEKKPISKKEAQTHAHHLYQTGLDKKNRIESLKNKIIEEEEKGKKLNKPASETNQKFLENVMEKYRSIINQLFSGLIETSQNFSNINEGSSNFDINSVQLNRLSLSQLTDVLVKFGFVHFNNSSTKNDNTGGFTEASNNNDDKSHINADRKLIHELWEALKDAEGYVNVDHFFIFILAIINLYEYYLYASYLKTQRNISDSPEKTEKPEKPEKTKRKKYNIDEVMTTIAADITNKIVTKTKYGAYDEHNNFLIPLEKAKVINKEFGIFYINFMNSKAHLTKRVQRKNNSTSYSIQATYKPQIDENSKRIYNEYRNKILDLNNSTEMNSKKEKEKGILEYIDKLIVKKKKKENMYAKMKEEFSEKELEGCTFKPKINEDYHTSREGLEIDDRSGRWDKLYKTGIQIVSSKKDKPKDVIEVELYGKECTFRPKIFSDQPIKEDSKIQNDIYNEKSYELLYNRLKHGRLERIIKDCVHERGEFPPQLEEFLNRTKKDGYSPKATSVKQKSLKLKADEINGSPTSTNNRGNLSSAGNETSQDETVENFNNDPEKKDAIPLLIIDVNIRPGVKKKIYVFDGDTSEGLAEKFSKEHNLDNDTKAKLQVLIQSHMSRLLMRIDEENQSISEKSSTYNLS